MANNIVGICGAFIILLSSWIVGGTIGIVIGTLVFLFGAILGSDYSTAGPSYKLIVLGAVIVYFGHLLFGGVFAVTLGVLIMVMGLFLTTGGEQDPVLAR